MSIGERLKEERERLGFTQPSFAGLAETTKKSQIDYEKDLTQPKAGYLAVIAKVGADVQYIITGQRSASVLPTDEALILEKYRRASEVIRNKMLMLLLGSEEADGVVNQSGNTISGQQIGNNHGQINNFDKKSSADQNIHGDVKIKSKGRRSQAAFNISNNEK